MSPSSVPRAFALVILAAVLHKTEIKCAPVNPQPKSFQIVPVHAVPFYKLVRYFTTQTERRDPKVYELNISHFQYYTHIYHAWKEANTQYSVVAVMKKTHDFIGANMVYAVNDLTKMYAPDTIGDVLDFVTTCYKTLRTSNHSVGLVSTLRPYTSESVNKAMIREVTNRFKQTAPTNSYHLLWENSTTMNSFLMDLSYEKMFCGNSTIPENKCDWTSMGLPPAVTNSLCIYRLVKH
ncbi:hypothetical protein CSKR_104064 [Clonorchis sinensis]|uniref:Uncharacterized protein n=2 Tax=Clonorchis sinensis TaxID=79923 RepID=A0A8T1MIH8_CLOSI|nr:hypothetical protein CSKR_104064 [Clonorchis sinensis]GAA31702.2 hypothetical protein CLF_104861 [Clonorchis sinensis]